MCVAFWAGIPRRVFFFGGGEVGGSPTPQIWRDALKAKTRRPASHFVEDTLGQHNLRQVSLNYLYLFSWLKRFSKHRNANRMWRTDERQRNFFVFCLKLNQTVLNTNFLKILLKGAFWLFIFVVSSALVWRYSRGEKRQLKVVWTGRNAVLNCMFSIVFGAFCG